MQSSHLYRAAAVLQIVVMFERLLISVIIFIISLLLFLFFQTSSIVGLSHSDGKEAISYIAVSMLILAAILFVLAVIKGIASIGLFMLKRWGQFTALTTGGLNLFLTFIPAALITVFIFQNGQQPTELLVISGFLGIGFLLSLIDFSFLIYLSLFRRKVVPVAA